MRSQPIKPGSSGHGLSKAVRVAVVGDTVVSEEGLAAIVGRDKRYHICGGAHGFYDAGELVRKHHPDLLLIEPFLEDRDGIRWIKGLAAESPRTRILIVSRQSEQVYAERALQAGAGGYWMKNGSAQATIGHRGILDIKNGGFSTIGSTPGFFYFSRSNAVPPRTRIFPIPENFQNFASTSSEKNNERK